MNIIDVGLKFNSNMSRIGTIEGIVLHHSGVSVLQSVEIIHNYHKNTNKWAGIGYHFYVRKDGKIYKGRPLEYAGAHCPGANTNSIGICAEGDYNTETMSEAQKQAIKELIIYLKGKYNIKWIKGHREVIATNCPGSKYPLEELKNAKQEVADTYKTFVKNVQANIGARVDGIAGNETISKTITISAKRNNRHALVRVLQVYLGQLGYTEVGNADGIAGAKFTAAVKHFQRDNGCVADGEITARAKTWKKLLRLA